MGARLLWCMDQTLNNVLVLGRDAQGESSVPEFSELPDILIEATHKLTPVVLPEVYATDSIDGKIKATTTNLGPYPLGKNTIVWSAKNSLGSRAIASQYLLVKDTQAPMVFAPADISVEATGKETAVDFGVATATDSVDGIIPVTTGSAGTALPPGEHHLAWLSLRQLMSQPKFCRSQLVWERQPQQILLTAHSHLYRVKQGHLMKASTPLPGQRKTRQVM